MPKRDSTGPKGQGPMTGLGSGKCIVPLNTPEEEMTFLKNQERVLSEELGRIKARIAVLEASEKKEKKDENRNYSHKSKLRI